MEKFYQLHIQLFLLIYTSVKKIKCHIKGHNYTIYFSIDWFKKYKIEPITDIYVCSCCDKSIAKDEFIKYNRKQKIKSIL